MHMIKKNLYLLIHLFFMLSLNGCTDSTPEPTQPNLVNDQSDQEINALLEWCGGDPATPTMAQITGHFIQTVFREISRKKLFETIFFEPGWRKKLFRDVDLIAAIRSVFFSSKSELSSRFFGQKKMFRAV